MREKLAEREGRRGQFTATFQEPGTFSRAGYLVVRMLFVNVLDEQGAEVTDHIWFERRKWNQGLLPGDRVTFRATVKRYWKGYHDARRMDYKLAWPEGVRVLDRPSSPRDPAGQMLLRFDDPPRAP